MANPLGKGTELECYGISAEEYARQRALGMRWCCGCKRFKNADEFTKRGSVCKPCRKAYQANWYLKNKERCNAQSRASYYEHQKERIQYARTRWNSFSNSEKQEISFRDRLKTRFGITTEQYDSILQKQGGGCAVCGSKQNGWRLPVDHDHSCCPGRKSCGKCIRGILCVRCNTIIGFLEKNRDLVPLCEAYISSHKTI